MEGDTFMTPYKGKGIRSISIVSCAETECHFTNLLRPIPVADSVDSGLYSVEVN